MSMSHGIDAPGEPAGQGLLYRVAAFAETSPGGNPAGVWVGDQLPDPQIMQQIATRVGFSETAFVAPAGGARRQVRYFSPEAEVSFCGHATIAAGAVLGPGPGATTYEFRTAVGAVVVGVRRRSGHTEVSLTSVATRHRPVPSPLLAEALGILGWRQADLDTRIPAAVAYAGAWHLVLAARDAARLASLDYDFEALKALMHRETLTTLQLVWREHESLFHSRNPFPVGGVVEDPATGAAAAALGGYLRDAGLLRLPASFVIRQGVAMGRPSVLHVDVPADGGIVVSGRAVAIG